MLTLRAQRARRLSTPPHSHHHPTPCRNRNARRIKLDFVNFQRVTGVHLHFENDREPDDEKTEVSRLRFFGSSTKRVDVSELKKC